MALQKNQFPKLGIKYIPNSLLSLPLLVEISQVLEIVNDCLFIQFLTFLNVLGILNEGKLSNRFKKSFYLNTHTDQIFEKKFKLFFFHLIPLILQEIRQINFILVKSQQDQILNLKLIIASRMKKQESNKIQALNGPPLDFSFKSIRSINQLLQDTESKVKLASHDSDQRKEDLVKKSAHQQLNVQQNRENSHGQSFNQTKLQIIRTIELSETKILDLNKNASKKKEKSDKKPLKVVQSKSSALFLRYNKITSVEGLFSVVGKIFPNINNLIWIDLSFNRLVELVDDFALFPNLKNIYLHSNFIYDFKEIQKLAKVKHLRSLTIHANPLQKFAEFRVLIAYIIPQLQKIDSTLLTKRQKDRGEVIKIQFKKYPVIKNPQPRPDESDNEEQG